MRQEDIDRVEFFSVEDLSATFQLSKAENILRKKLDLNINNVNEVLELYHINKYIDNNIFLNNWTSQDIEYFKQKSIEFSTIIKTFFSKISDDNFHQLYTSIIQGYLDSFWEVINNLHCYKKFSKTHFENALLAEPFMVNAILKNSGLVNYYDKEIKKILLNDKQAAEIIISYYELKNDFTNSKRHLPKSLSAEDKEQIILNYLSEENVNLNYLRLIETSKKKKDFTISDKTKLEAKRINKSLTEKFFTDNQGIKFGVSISFLKNATNIKHINTIDNVIHYSYSADFILKEKNPYFLFHYFDILFEYVDEQKRINLVNKRSNISAFERVIGSSFENEYFQGTAFLLSEMRSQGEINGYSKVLAELNIEIEEIIHSIFTKSLQEKYKFPKNANFFIPTSTNTFFEKVRIMAPEFESILKQYKLFVEEEVIDFDLLQMSSSPTTIKDIPSLVKTKYIYLNEENNEMIHCANLFFSEQSNLTYTDPFKEKRYRSFFDLLANEDICFDNYKEHQKSKVNFLIGKDFIRINKKRFIEIVNFERLYIIKDLYENEFGSFHHYTEVFKKESLQMVAENVIFAEDTLFAKPEQDYFNYFLNKSKFTNGLDLRNSYLHGTQPNSNEVEIHEFSYFIYLKLIVLTLFKIEDDLYIYEMNK